VQHDSTFEAAISTIETQESGTNILDISLEDDSDDPYDIQNNDLWYMHNDFYYFYNFLNFFNFLVLLDF
jgi:hypothetical protein